MATQAQILAAIVAKITAIADIGKVFDYERYSNEQKKLQDLYLSGARIKAWFVYRESTRERDINVGEVQRLHGWRIVGLLGLDDADATGKIIQNDVESIATAFRTDRTLGNLVEDLKDQSGGDDSGIQVDGIEPVMFAGVLCHRARLRLMTDGTESSI